MTRVFTRAERDEDQRNVKRVQLRKRKRPKERVISEILDMVFEWRRYYTGFIDKDGKLLKVSLDQAAHQVGISKKSLDDYLLQIRFGAKFGFDFKKH